MYVDQGKHRMPEQTPLKKETAGGQEGCPVIIDDDKPQ